MTPLTWVACVLLAYLIGLAVGLMLVLIYVGVALRMLDQDASAGGSLHDRADTP